MDLRFKKEHSPYYRKAPFNRRPDFKIILKDNNNGLSLLLPFSEIRFKTIKSLKLTKQFKYIVSQTYSITTSFITEMLPVYLRARDDSPTNSVYFLAPGY